MTQLVRQIETGSELETHHAFLKLGTLCVAFQSHVHPPHTNAVPPELWPLSVLCLRTLQVDERHPPGHSPPVRRK